MPSAWLKDAVFYEIYPQSFYDSNGDGIGDIEGIIQKLDYVAGLGFNAIWLNPCFDSPFKDAGYDVRDYKKVAPRYGTNDDLRRLFTVAHSKGIHVLLDLVPGHTSEEHEWFQKSKSPQKNEYWNRYIWTDSWGTWVGGMKTIFGEADRNATYIVNFFKSQPALNYGFANPDQVWQMPVDHPDCLATVEAIKDIMRFWLDAGCDGFRVDMASSLVKFDDTENSKTCGIWRGIRATLDSEYPGTALVSEWSHPKRALKCGFDADFLLAFYENSGYKSLFRDGDKSFFNRDSTGTITRFLDEYLPHYEATKHDGFISLTTGNHDVPRLSHTLSMRQLALAYTFIFTMPGVPFLYYGDEIGMRYQSELPTKEGGYDRTGSRTPMQWTNGANKGFSSASADALYLPVDAEKNAPTVEMSERDPQSLLNTVKKLIALRKSEQDLGSSPNLRILHANALPFIYQRGNFIIALNPSGKTVIGPDKESALSIAAGEKVFAIEGGSASDGAAVTIENGKCHLPPESTCIWKLKV
jgi:maltose alpha-D-glucosyltransferase/alpha-amylase